jgi:hypothetical protein
MHPLSSMAPAALVTYAKFHMAVYLRQTWCVSERIRETQRRTHVPIASMLAKPDALSELSNSVHRSTPAAESPSDATSGMVVPLGY